MECSFCARCGGVWGTVCASETATESEESETPGATANELGWSVWASVFAIGRVGWESVFATATGPLGMVSATAWPVMSAVEPVCALQVCGRSQICQHAFRWSPWKSWKSGGFRSLGLAA
jgi:hypothetical protein